MTKPQRLKKGDVVGVIAPASPPNQENLQRGILFLEELGLKVKQGKFITEQNGYLAGSDEQRLEDLHSMFLDQEVKAIFCAGGGYGTARISSGIDYEIIKNNPKIFWGYSDITFLHTAIHKTTGLITFHGPMLGSDIGKKDVHPLSKELFVQLFEPRIFVYSEVYSPLRSWIEGTVTGELVGGNLSLLVSTLGTPFEIDTKGKLILIEEINEEPRSIDRMLNQLYLAGKLEEAAGIILGDFHACEPKRELTLNLEEVLNHFTLIANKPTMSGFKIGHCSPNISAPLGALATMNTYEKRLTIASGVE